MTEHKHQHNQKDPACLEVFAKLSAYIDGELDGLECHHIEEHISDCPPCVQFLKGLRRCVETSREFEGQGECPKMPPEMEAKLREAWQNALKRRENAH